MTNPRPNVGIIIQARTGSKRLPDKVFRKIGKKPVLGHLLDRLLDGRLEYNFIVATSNKRGDKKVEDYCLKRKVACFRGSESDVLARYVSCALHYDLEHIVRLTADNILTDLEELQNLILSHLEGRFDYSHSFEQMPLGVGAEVFKREALVRSFEEGTLSNHKEHVNEYIQENLSKFRVYKYTVTNKSKIGPEIRATIDYETDLLEMKRIYSLFGNRWPSTEDLITACT